MRSRICKVDKGDERVATVVVVLVAAGVRR
jgi:hypothetical protein